MRTLAHAADREALLHRLASLRPDAERRWGKMSVHQMVCHLTANFQMATGEIPVRLRGVPPPVRRAVKWFALYLPWPRGLIPTSPELDAMRRGPPTTAFATDVAELRDRIARSGEQPAAGRPAHPVFGEMAEANWLRWGYRHVDHHLRQFGL